MKTRPVILLAVGLVLSMAGCGSSSTSEASDSNGSSTSSAAASGKAYPMSEVERHNTADSCWAVIDGNVVDLTAWIGDHPGGPDKITPLCGTDATERFKTQHDSASEPNKKVKSFTIGTLAK